MQLICKEVRFEHRIVPGELNLPRDLDEDDRTGMEQLQRANIQQTLVANKQLLTWLVFKANRIQRCREWSRCQCAGHARMFKDSLDWSCGGIVAKCMLTVKPSAGHRCGAFLSGGLLISGGWTRNYSASRTRTA